MSGRKTMKRSSSSSSSSSRRSRSRSRSRSRNNLRSKLLVGITKGIVQGNAHGIKWGDVADLTEENVTKLGFEAAMKKQKRLTAKKMHRYPDWVERVEANIKKGMTPEESIRRVRLELSPNETLVSHKNANVHMTKAQKREFYKGKALREAAKEAQQFANWAKYNPEKNMSEFTSLRAIRKFLDKAEIKQ